MLWVKSSFHARIQARRSPGRLRPDRPPDTFSTTRKNSARLGTGIKWIIDPGDELKDGTKLAIVQFPQDAPFPEMKVKVDAQLPAQIAMGDGKGPGHNIKETLEVIRGLVAEAKRLAPPPS